MMRRSLTLTLPLLALAALALPAGAAAAPTISIKAQIIPIRGFPHTGNILGAGAGVKAEVTISGTEYGGFPPPLIGVNAFLPTGTRLHTQGFKTCPTRTIFEEKNPEACPKGSAAGPVGKVKGVVAFGKTRVPEEAELFSFFAPGGGLEFFTFGHTPTTLEIPSSGHYTHLGGGGGFGPEFIAAVPLVETVPGAPYASVEAIDFQIGAAYRKNGKPVYYGTVPKSCPKGGFRVRSVMTFAENGEITRPEPVTVNFRVACPPKKKK
jgi:hypothetical protein